LEMGSSVEWMELELVAMMVGQMGMVAMMVVGRLGMGQMGLVVPKLGQMELVTKLGLGWLGHRLG
jgi:hypothetical protein